MEQLKCEGKKLVFGWISAYKGIYGNEVADKLAKEATMDEAYQELKVPFRDYQSIHKEELFKSTIKEIKAQAVYKGKFYFDHFYRENEYKPWFYGIQENINKRIQTY
ncbi:hypothetical protein X777_06700 [Ooceraea biroi]|uniref:RNase H type-1 domain-containing protein n=1 Tax=Ooceraea biroi TaxID=2015173 RepID=A0A026WCN6_OOCBI|nr:hypothetical protein X777_06700 [Ooceraea biroi]